MKVAIDSGPLKSGHKVRGVGMYTSELIKALGSRMNAVDFQKENLKKYDIVHFPYFSPFFISFRLVPRVKTVITIHDLIPLIYPNHYPPGTRGKIRFFLQKILIRFVDAIITDTEASKKDIVRFLKVDPNKVHVIYLAPKEIFRKISDKDELKKVKEKYNLPDKFVLYVGDVNYTKNIPALIKACKIADIPLVICGKQALEVEDLGEDLRNLKGPRDWARFLFGKPHPETSHYKEILKTIYENGNVIRLGFVSDKDLVNIFNLATLYCQPSFYEGFGLPVLEAIACGTPVVCSRTQALVEISEGAATFVDPNDSKDMARGFKKLVKNPKLPRDYSWKKTADETFEVYNSIYAQK